ncbi:hypothetical protein ACIBW9_00185 [Streptomyces sp. NPDC049541]|uniref:hypothetical protein n=1 Tax=Streptomyces sp. NPDC049541 TaxID=3365594 RepID=UPI0037A1A36D
MKLRSSESDSAMDRELGPGHRRAGSGPPPPRTQALDRYPLEQAVELAVIKKLLGHAHIGVTATVYAHVRLRLQRNAIDALGTALIGPEATGTVDGDEPPPCAAPVR